MRGRLETETLEELHLVVTCTRCLEILDLCVRETKRQLLLRQRLSELFPPL